MITETQATSEVESGEILSEEQEQLIAHLEQSLLDMSEKFDVPVFSRRLIKPSGENVDPEEQARVKEQIILKEVFRDLDHYEDTIIFLNSLDSAELEMAIGYINYSHCLEQILVQGLGIIAEPLSGEEERDLIIKTIELFGIPASDEQKHNLVRWSTETRILFNKFLPLDEGRVKTISLDKYDFRTSLAVLAKEDGVFLQVLYKGFADMNIDNLKFLWVISKAVQTTIVSERSSESENKAAQAFVKRLVKAIIQYKTKQAELKFAMADLIDLDENKLVFLSDILVAEEDGSISKYQIPGANTAKLLIDNLPKQQKDQSLTPQTFDGFVKEDYPMAVFDVDRVTGQPEKSFMETQKEEQYRLFRKYKKILLIKRDKLGNISIGKKLLVYNPEQAELK